MRKIISLVLLAILLQIGSALHVDKYGLKLKGKNNFKFIDKFAFGEEVYALVKVRVRFENPYQYDKEFEGLKFNMLYDKNWDFHNLQEADCDKKEQN